MRFSDFTFSRASINNVVFKSISPELKVKTSLDTHMFRSNTGNFVVQLIYSQQLISRKKSLKTASSLINLHQIMR